MALDLEKVAGHLAQRLLKVISSAHCRLHDLLRILTHFTPPRSGPAVADWSLEQGAAAPPVEACQRGKWASWTGLALRSRWRPSPADFETVVLAGRALRVPVAPATGGLSPSIAVDCTTT
jgi:hypothetical protein